MKKRFCIDTDNINHIFGKTNAKAYNDEDKKKIINDLYFNGVPSEQTKERLKRTFW